MKRVSVESVRGVVAIAGRSVPEDGRGAAGAAGARLSSERVTQQAGVAHLDASWSQQPHVGFETVVARPTSAQEAPGKPVAMTSDRASKADETFWNARAIIIESLCGVNPYGSGWQH